MWSLRSPNSCAARSKESKGVLDLRRTGVQYRGATPHRNLHERSPNKPVAHAWFSGNKERCQAKKGRTKRFKGRVISARWPNKMPITASLPPPHNNNSASIHRPMHLCGSSWIQCPKPSDLRGVLPTCVLGNKQTDLGPGYEPQTACCLCLPWSRRPW